MTDDLVKRLSRIGERVAVPCPDNIEGCLVFHFRVETDPVCQEAIDRIEKLEREKASWKGAYDGAVWAMNERIEALEAGFQVADEKWSKISARCEAFEAALLKICDGPRDADKSYAELFAEVCWEARAALAGEKKDGEAV